MRQTTFPEEICTICFLPTPCQQALNNLQEPFIEMWWMHLLTHRWNHRLYRKLHHRSLFGNFSRISFLSVLLNYFCLLCIGLKSAGQEDIYAEKPLYKSSNMIGGKSRAGNMPRKRLAPKKKLSPRWDVWFAISKDSSVGIRNLSSAVNVVGQLDPQIIHQFYGE